MLTRRMLYVPEKPPVREYKHPNSSSILDLCNKIFINIIYSSVVGTSNGPSSLDEVHAGYLDINNIAKERTFGALGIVYIPFSPFSVSRLYIH